jgi:hypothetical protein
VIAGQPTQGTVETRRVVTAHLDAGLTQPPPQSAGRISESTHPVVDHPHADALPCFRHESVDKPLSGFIFMENIALEVDVVRGCMDRLKPCRVVFSCVLEQPHVIAADQRSFGDSRQSSVGNPAERFQSLTVVSSYHEGVLTVGLHLDCNRNADSCLEVLPHRNRRNGTEKTSTMPVPDISSVVRHHVLA